MKNNIHTSLHSIRILCSICFYTLLNINAKGELAIFMPPVLRAGLQSYKDNFIPFNFIFLWHICLRFVSFDHSCCSTFIFVEPFLGKYYWGFTLTSGRNLAKFSSLVDGLFYSCRSVKKTIRLPVQLSYSGGVDGGYHRHHQKKSHASLQMGSQYVKKCNMWQLCCFRNSIFLAQFLVPVLLYA